MTQSKASPIYLPTNQSLIPSCHTDAHLQYWLTLYIRPLFSDYDPEIMAFYPVTRCAVECLLEHSTARALGGQYGVDP